MTIHVNVPGDQYRIVMQAVASVQYNDLKKL